MPARRVEQARPPSAVRNGGNVRKQGRSRREAVNSWPLLARVPVGPVAPEGLSAGASCLPAAASTEQQRKRNAVQAVLLWRCREKTGWPTKSGPPGSQTIMADGMQAGWRARQIPMLSDLTPFHHLPILPPWITLRCSRCSAVPSVLS